MNKINEHLMKKLYKQFEFKNHKSPQFGRVVGKVDDYTAIVKNENGNFNVDCLNLWLKDVASLMDCIILFEFVSNRFEVITVIEFQTAKWRKNGTVCFINRQFTLHEDFIEVNNVKKIIDPCKGSQWIDNNTFVSLIIPYEQFKELSYKRLMWFENDM